MSIFSRSRNRISKATATPTTTHPRSRLLTIEPLEDRRLLAAVPLNFDVSRVAGNGNETKLSFTWTDNGAAGGYEIQSSVNGLNDEENTDDWKTGLWRRATKVPADSSQITLERFRSYYFRIQAIPPDDPDVWSPIVFTSAPAEDNVVKVSAAVLPGVEMITLRWPEELKFASSTYTISRKAKDDLTWTELVSGDTGNDWVDFDVEEGKAYEYEVKRSSPSGTGYVYAGLELALEDADSTIESPGTVILVVDDTQIGVNELETELTRLEQDLFAEGWHVERHNVPPHDSPDPDPQVPPRTQAVINRIAASKVRDDIITEYLRNDIPDVKAVFIIGHVPIPMSGHNCPDGHGERPFPADVFYGDVDGVWSDDTGINNPALCALSGADVANGPNDGAFDQITVPLDGNGPPAELMVGRVDMRDLPDFGESETELLRRYLDKDHAFRTGQVEVERKARIRDRFARTYSSTGAWQTLSGFFGPAESPTELEPDNINVNKWTDTTWPLWPLVMGLRSIVSGDFTGDSSVEIVTASADDNRIAWYDRDSQGNLEMHVVSDKVRHVSSVLLADLDGDGNDDILSASLIVNASAGTTSSGAWGTLSGLLGPAENPTPTEPDHINVWKWEDTDWTRRVTLAPGRMCGCPRWTTLSLAI